jgi:cobalt-zinc-cadmium efflux system outer membrane protein
MRGAVAAIFMAVLLAGCVRARLNENFTELSAMVEGRTGYDVAWIGVIDEQEPIYDIIAALMEDDLAADEAVQVALLNNRELQASFAELGIQVGEFVQAGLLPNPMVDAELRKRAGLKVIEGVAIEDILEILLIPLRRKFEGAQLEAAKARAAGEVIDLAAETRIAYWDYVAARQHRALVEEMLFSTYARLNMAWQLRAAGNVPLLFFYLERERYEHTRLLVAEAEMEMLESREQLNALMGLWGAGVQWEAIDRLPPVPDQELDLTDVEASAIEASLDLTIALYQVANTAADLGIRRVTAVIPELKGGFAFEREPETEYKLKQPEPGEYKLDKETEDVWWEGGSVSLEVPIFDQKQGRRAAARMEVRRRWEMVNDLAVDIRAAARLAAYRLEYTRRRAAFYNEVLIPVRHNVVLQTHLQYNGMHMGIFDLLESKEMELDTAREYVENLRNYWEARTQAEQLLMGRLYDTEFHTTGASRQMQRSMGIQRPGQGD